MALTDQDTRLIDAANLFRDDPLGFVLFAFPWRRMGLEAFDGPDEWQAAFLKETGQEVKGRGFDGVHPVLPIRQTRASGYGIDKSSLAAWLVL